jgi:hypothetical protein
MLQTSASNPNQSLGQADTHRMAHPQIGYVGYLPYLLNDRLIDLLNAMAKKIAPQRTRAIEVPLAMDIRQP